MEAKEAIRKHALLNALKYGKAEPGRIIGKIIGEMPELKKDMDSLREMVGDAVVSVNKLSKEKIEAELRKSAPEMLEKKEEKKKELPELNTDGKPVVMRFEPSPSGPLHIGHAYVLGLNAEYCRQYKGKLILRIADTNPANIDPKAYDMIPEDAKWLTGNSVAEVIIQSDNLDTYYSHALEMIDKGHAYICTCSAEEFRELAKKKEECPCRKNASKRNLELWKLMFTKFQEGEAVMRIKTDMKHKNPAMRDFPLMRINEDEHPRKGKKYRVWPLMNFSVACDDYEEGMTHILRAKDHTDNARRQEYIQNAMGWDVPQTQFVGRINFIGLNLSASETRKMIEEGKFESWQDIRIPFLGAMKKRGFQPGAFIKYALGVGVTLTDKKVDKDEFFKALHSFNKEIIDPESDRYFFVDNPVKIEVKGAPAQNVELDLHPNTRKGGRKFRTADKFYISRADMDTFEDGEIIRLMDCLNLRKKGAQYVFDSLEYEKYKAEGKKIIHWLPAESEAIDAEVVMPDGKSLKGLGEESMKNLKEGDIVQLERLGFCRLEEASKEKLVFWFAHK